MNKFTDEQLTALRTHIKEYADENLIHDRNNRKLYACPYCDSGHGTSNNSDGAFSVDMKTYRFKCFSCNRTGDLFDLIGQVEKIENFTDQVARAVSLYGTEPAETVQHDQISHGNIHTGMTEEQKEIAEKQREAAIREAIEAEKRRLAETGFTAEDEVNTVESGKTDEKEND